MYNLYSFTISRLNNAEITGFFLNVQKAINEEDAETCGFDTTVWNDYRAKLKKLVDQVYMSQGSEYTAKMKLFDDKRVAIFRRLRLRLQMVNYAEENVKLNAVKDVVEIDILGKYNGDIKKNLANSGIMPPQYWTGMISVVQKPSSGATKTLFKYVLNLL